MQATAGHDLVNRGTIAGQDNLGYAALSVGAGVAMGTLGALGALPETVGVEVTNSVATPHGLAVQSATPEALSALQEAQNGAMLYRAGTLGVQNTADAQFWSFENPLHNSKYANQMGMPGVGAPVFDWVMAGNLSPGRML